MNKRFALLLILILTASSPIVVKPTHSSIPKPSVPEFTVELGTKSYDVPAAYSIDPFTGENVTVRSGYHWEYEAIVVTIKNQPFVPYYDNSSGWTLYLMYNVRVKGQYSEDWTFLHSASKGLPLQSDSEYTIVKYTSILGTAVRKIPAGAKVYFQVEAMIGYTHRDSSYPFAPWVFVGETSGWSKTQTLTISAQATEPQTTPPTEPPPTETPPEETPTEPPPNGSTGLDPTPFIIAVPIVLAIILGAVFYRKRRKD